MARIAIVFTGGTISMRNDPIAGGNVPVETYVPGWSSCGASIRTPCHLSMACDRPIGRPCQPRIPRSERLESQDWRTLNPRIGGP